MIIITKTLDNDNKYHYYSLNKQITDINYQ